MRMEKLTLAAIVFTLGGLSACRPAATPDAAPAAPAATEAAPAATPTPADAAATAATPDTAVPATEAVAAAAAPAAKPAIASAEGEKPGLRIEVTELKRASGDTVSLKFVLINDTDEAFSITSNYLGDTAKSQDYSSVGGVHLVDAVGKKKYMVVRDTETLCVCSTSVKEIPAKSRVNLWAKYPAPPAGTSMVSIVVPHFSPMDDVPIAQ